MPQNWESRSRSLPNNVYILRSRWHNMSHPQAIKHLTGILKKGRFPSQYIVHEHSLRKYFHKKNAVVSSRFERKLSSTGTRCCHDNTGLEGKKIYLSLGVLFSPGTWGPLSSLPRILTLSFSHFLLGELCCQGKGVVFSFHNCFWAGKGCCP